MSTESNITAGGEEGRGRGTPYLGVQLSIKKTSTCKANFGRFCSFGPKLNRIRVGLHCIADEKSQPLN